MRTYLTHVIIIPSASLPVVVPCLMALQSIFSFQSFERNIVCKTVLTLACQLPRCTERVLNGGWPLCNSLLCSADSPKLHTISKIASFTTSRLARRRGRRVFLQSSPPLSSPCPSLSFSYHLSLSCLTLSCASHLSYPPPPFSLLACLLPPLYSISFFSPPWIFLFMRALGLLCYLLRVLAVESLAAVIDQF